MSKLINEHRDINVDYEWWEFQYEDFVERMQEIGIEVSTETTYNRGKTKKWEKPAIYFSGFWFQGDGACFEGRVSNWPLFLKNFDTKYQELKDLSLSWVHSGRYYHEYNMNFTFDYNPEPSGFEEGSLRFIAYEVLEKEIQALAWELEAEAKEFIREKAKDLYRTLEKEHDHLTSDDVVFDTLEANEYELTDSFGENLIQFAFV